MPDPTLGIGAAGEVYHSCPRKATHINLCMRADRAPYWKDGAIAVKVLRKGSLSKVTLEHTEVSRQIEECQEG